MNDLTQQALTALADEGLGNESAAEAFVLGYQAGYDVALSMAIGIEQRINSDEPTREESEACVKAFFKVPGVVPYDTISEQAKQFWLDRGKTALAGVIAMKTKEQA